MFVLVVLISAYFISNVWNKWNASPLIVTLNAYGTSVRDLPFPAVTICMCQIELQKLFYINFHLLFFVQSRQYESSAKERSCKVSSQQWEIFRSSKHMSTFGWQKCNQLGCRNVGNVSKRSTGSETLNECPTLRNVNKFVFWLFWKVAQPCAHMLVACKYGGEDLNCTEIFSSTLTDGGLCCMFNGVHRQFMMNFGYKLRLWFSMKKLFPDRNVSFLK